MPHRIEDDDDETIGVPDEILDDVLDAENDEEIDYPDDDSD